MLSVKRKEMTRHWISSARFTVLVETDERVVITRAAPNVRKFQGQPLANLHTSTRPLRQQGPLYVNGIACTRWGLPV